MFERLYCSVQFAAVLASHGYDRFASDVSCADEEHGFLTS